MTIFRVLVAVLGLVLLLVLIRSVGQTGTLEDFWYENQALLDQPWALAALTDLYVGFGLMAVFMIFVERSFMAGLLWAAPMLVLGNLWAVVWLLLRLPRIAERLRAPTKPGA